MRKRANGNGCISYDKSRNKYFASIYDPYGKRIGKRFNTQQEAETWLLTIRTEFVYNDYIPKTDLTLGQWFIQWLKTFKQDLKANTLKSYLAIGKRLEPIAHLLLQDITALELQQYFNTLKDANLSSSTQIHTYTMVNQLLKKAKQLGYIKKNPMEFLDRPKQRTNKQITVFTDQEIQTIVNALKSNPRRQKFYYFFLIAINTGARIGEILALKWNDINQENNTIRLDSTLIYTLSKITENAPKTKSGLRTVSVPSHLIQSLEQLRNKALPSDYVFRIKQGRPMSYQVVTRTWRTILEENNIPYRSFHSIRHTNATQLLAAGIPILEVSHRLGHSKTSVTLDVYGHKLPGKDKEIGEKLNEIFPK